MTDGLHNNGKLYEQRNNLDLDRGKLKMNIISNKGAHYKMNTKKKLLVLVFSFLGFIIETSAASAKDFLFVGQDYPPFNYLDGKTIKGVPLTLLK